MGLFRSIGKLVSGDSKKDIKDMTVADVVKFKSSSFQELAKKSKVTSKTLQKYADTKLVDVPKATQDKIKKAFGIVG